MHALDCPCRRHGEIVKQAHGPEQHAYFITSRDAAEILGTIGYWHPFSSKYPAMFRGLELYWQVHPKFRPQGIATQAACLLVNHLFDATPTEPDAGTHFMR